MLNNDTLLDGVEMYFECMYTCDLSLIDKIFHPSCSLYDVDGDDLYVDPLSSYRETLRKRTPPISIEQPRYEEILSVDNLNENAAVVKVKVRIHHNVFVDFLSFAKTGNGWQIISKLWQLEEILEVEADFEGRVEAMAG